MSLQLIPAIDIRGGACVRLLRGDFSTSQVYAKDPLAPARRYASLGAPLLHLVDLDGAENGRRYNTGLIAAITQLCPVQAGGGVRSVDDIEQLLERGVQRVVLGSMAVSEPRTTLQFLDRFGPDRIVIALDVKYEDGDYRVCTHGWSVTHDESLDDILDLYLDSGLRHVLVTDIERDGAMTGPNLALYSYLVGHYPGLQIQASGGIRHVEDLRALQGHGLHAAISGKALLEQAMDPEEIEKFLRNA